MDFDDQELEKKVKSVFEKARSLTYEPSPYFETRVLAELRDRKSRQHGLIFWKRVAFAASTACLAVFLYVYLFVGTTIYNAEIHQAVAIRVELAKPAEGEIAFAQVDLPEGLRFYSQRHPELQNQKQLQIAWDSIKDKKFLPFVVMADHTGIQIVTVSFYDSENALVAKKTLRIRFNPSSQTG